MSGPPVTLAQACQSDEPDAALTALRDALVWSAQAISGELCTSPALAFRGVQGLDRALTEVDALVAALPGLLRAAEPGPTLAAALGEGLAELAAVQEQVARRAAELAELAAVRADLAARAAQVQKLADQIAELRRLERLGADLPRLQQTRAELEERCGALTAAAAGEELALRRACGQFEALATGPLDLLDRQSQAALARVRQLRGRLAEQADQHEQHLAAADQLANQLHKLELQEEQSAQRHAALAAEHDRLTALVRQQLEADQVIADALRRAITELTGGPGAADPPDHEPDVELAQDALAAARTAIDRIDQALARALDVHERARERTLAKRHLDEAESTT